MGKKRKIHYPNAGLQRGRTYCNLPLATVSASYNKSAITCGRCLRSLNKAKKGGRHADRR